MAGGGWEPKHSGWKGDGSVCTGVGSAVVGTGAACCGAGALRPTRPRRDGVSETQEQGGLPGEPWVGGMTRFSAGD